MNSIQQDIDTLLQMVKDWVDARFGFPGVIVLSVFIALLFLWVFWKQVVKVPGVPWLIGIFKRAPLPVFEPGVFGVLVADLENDSKNGAGASGLRSSIDSKTEGVTVVRLNRRIDGIGKGTPSSLAKAHKIAHRYLNKTQAQILIWGYVHTAGKGKELELFIDHLGEKGEAKPKPFGYETGIFIKDEFYSDMINVLAMSITSRYTMFQELQKQEMVSLVEPHAKACREFLRNENLPPLRRADVRNHLAKTLCTLAQHTDTIRLLGEAVELQKANLAEVSRDDDPELWAQAQDSLGVALLELGRQEIEQDHLKEAVASFRVALEVRTRDSMLVPWVVTQTNLAKALIELGGRSYDYNTTTSAISLLQEVIGDVTRESHPEEWATVKLYLGIALGVLEFGDAVSAPCVEDSVCMLQEVFTVWTRESHPQQWAKSKHNLGRRLHLFGRRSADNNLLEESVAAIRDALEMRTRAKAPLEWMESNVALGATLSDLGVRSVDDTYLLNSLAVLQENLGVAMPESTPRLWVTTAMTLGTVLRDLSIRGGTENRLLESIEILRQALLVVTKENDVYLWNLCSHWLALSLVCYGEETQSVIVLDEAILIAHDLLNSENIPFAHVNRRVYANCLCADVCRARYALSNDIGDVKSGISYVENALSCCMGKEFSHLDAHSKNLLGMLYSALAVRNKTQKSIKASICAFIEAFCIFKVGDLYMAKACCNRIVGALHILATYPSNVHLAILEKYKLELNRVYVWAYHNHVDFPWELVMGPEPDTDS